MGITPAQVERRRSHLGSSDMATLFGLNPYQSEYDLWLSKTGQLETGGSDAPWLQAGTDFEPLVLNKAEAVLGRILRNQYRSAKDEGIPLATHIDGIAVERGGRPVEAKTNGLFWPTTEQWGEPGTDQVPDRVMIQCQVHLKCAESDLCYVPGLFWGLRFALYEVPRDDQMVAMICDRATEWWQKHVVGQTPPDSQVSLEKIKLVRRETGKAILLPADATPLVAAWREAVAAETAARKAKEAALAEVLKALGDAEEATCPLGTITYKSVHRDAYTVEASDYRTARFKAARKGECNG